MSDEIGRLATLPISVKGAIHLRGHIYQIRWLAYDSALSNSGQCTC